MISFFNLAANDAQFLRVPTASTAIDPKQLRSTSLRAAVNNLLASFQSPSSCVEKSNALSALWPWHLPIFHMVLYKQTSL